MTGFLDGWKQGSDAKISLRPGDILCPTCGESKKLHSQARCDAMKLRETLFAGGWLPLRGSHRASTFARLRVPVRTEATRSQQVADADIRYFEEVWVPRWAHLIVEMAKTRRQRDRWLKVLVRREGAKDAFEAIRTSLPETENPYPRGTAASNAVVELHRAPLRTFLESIS